MLNLKKVFASVVLGAITAFALTLIAAAFVSEPDLGRAFEQWWVPMLALFSICWFPVVNKRLR